MSARLRLTKFLNQSARKRQPLPAADPLRKWNIVRGDKVQVVGSHSDAGKQGIVLQVLRKHDRVLVEGINVVTKQVKGNPDKGIKGRTIQKERTLPYRSVNLVDPVTNQPTRVTRQYLDDGTKVRVSKKSGAVIPRPDVLAMRRLSPTKAPTVSDTTDESEVWKISYVPR